MSRPSSNLRTRVSWASLLGIICVALVLMSGVVQVAHNHPSGQPDHDCALCISAHQVIQTVALVTLALSIRPITAVTTEPSLEPPSRYFFFKLACRPPPAVSVFA